MTDQTTKIGIDWFDDLVYAARVDSSKAEPEIKALLRLPRTGTIKHHLLEDGQLQLALPDNKVIVKRIRLTGANPKEYDRQSRFELIQSVLEDESEFLFDAVATNQNDIFLGTIIRRDALTSDEIFDHTTLSNDSGTPGYLMRAIALGRGYLTFCKEEAGDLICLADLSSRNASLCFIHKREIVGTAWMNTEKIDINHEKDVSRLAVELKTVLNYQVSSIAADGIKAPLAAVLLSGTKSGRGLIDRLKRNLTIDLRPPRFNSRFLADPSQMEKIPFESYLIPLGLATN